jgi:hypothetical protein
MPDIPPPRPNPGFIPHQPGEGAPGLQDLSTQAASAAQALANVANLEQQFLAALKQAQQANPANLGHLTPGFPGQALAAQGTLARALPSTPPPIPPPAWQAEQGLRLAERLAQERQTRVPPQEQTTKIQQILEGFRSQRQELEARLPPASPAPLPQPPPPTPASAPPPTPPPVQAPAPDPLQDYLAGLDPERQRSAQEAHQRAKYAVAPPPNPEMLRRQQEHVNISRQPMVVLGHGLLVPQTPAPAEGSIAPPPPVEPVTSPPGLAAERQRLAQEARAARLQATTRQVPPAPPNLVIPPVAMPQADLSGLAARMLQTAPQATPALPGGLAARMMALAPPPQQTGLPAAIPLPPSAGTSPLAARVGGQLQELQRRIHQAENEDLARQAQEAMQQAEEEERQQRERVNRVQYGRLETPLARAALEGGLRAEMRQRTTGYEQEALQSRIAARTIGGPESQALTTAQVQAMTLAQTNQMRQQAQVAQAQATFARTPEGQAQIRMQQQARTDTLQAQELRQRAESVAQYGRLGAALREASERVTHFGSRTLEVSSSLQRIVGGVSSLGAAASPQAVATLRGSMTLAQARLGREFLPAMDLQSYVLQRGSEMYRRAADSSPVARGALATGLGAVQGAMIGAATPIPGGALIGGVVGGLVGLLSSIFADKRPDIARSYEGLPQGGYTTGEGFYERLQTAGINMSPLDTQVLAEQLRNTTGLLEKIERNTGGMPNMVPAWR